MNEETKKTWHSCGVCGSESSVECEEADDLRAERDLFKGFYESARDERDQLLKLLHEIRALVAVQEDP